MLLKDSFSYNDYNKRNNEEEFSVYKKGELTTGIELILSVIRDSIQLSGQTTQSLVDRRKVIQPYIVYENCYYKLYTKMKFHLSDNNT